VVGLEHPQTADYGAVMAVDWKQRAVEQWTADPCGPLATDAEGLLRGRREYAPWMPSALDYAGAQGLDVLDVGCGQGIDLCEYARAGAHATGVDLTPRHVELARTHLAELGLEGTVLQGDAEHLPFEDASFDRVSSNGVLHHTPNIEAALREIHRVLRPGGLATVIVYNRDSFHFWVHQVAFRGVLHGGLVRERGIGGVLSTGVERTSIGARPLVRVYSRRQMRALLSGAGFERIEIDVSPFRPSDTVLTRRLPARVPLGHGWYLIARGSKRK